MNGDDDGVVLSKIKGPKFITGASEISVQPYGL